MTMTSQPSASRRGFLKSTAATGLGLVIGVRLPVKPARADSAAAFAPNAFIRIAPDNTVTVLSKHIEFGQGPHTGLATIVAEELDADWAQMRAEHAPANSELYNNLMFGQLQGTGGSTAIANSYDQLRKAGAQARALLVRAAADRWQVDPAEITVAKGTVRHGERALTFGDLAEEAAGLDVEVEATPKNPKDFTLIAGSVPKLDTVAKTTGRAMFTLDQDADGMLTVLVQHAPRFGGKVASFDDTDARKVRGVVDVVAVPEGVAVLAEGFWAAKKGRDALRVTWDEAEAEKRGSEELFQSYRTKAAGAGLVAHASGDAASALQGAAKVVEMTYEFPFLAHAPMEANDCFIRGDADGGCTMRFGSQLQSVDQNVAAKILGIEPGKVRIDTLLAGGSFGRRATPAGDMAAEAANVLKAAGADRPLKLVWTREDDIRGGRYRPLYVEKVRGAVDENGDILAWEHRIVGQSILTGSPFDAMVKDGIDATSVEGASDLPYAMPNRQIEVHNTEVGVPVLWWRSVGHTHTAYSTETFFDLLAREAGRDPLEMRKALLKEHPRHLGVLERVAEMADWDTPPPEGRARGVAVHKSFDSYVAQIAEVSLGADGLPVVHKVWCAVDCGVPVNLNVIAAQMEGGIGYGLGAALHDEITLQDGYVQQANFDDYPSLRITEMPEVEVEVIRSSEAPTGVGEPGVPPVAPAVANAILALTGEMPARLPFARSMKRV